MVTKHWLELVMKPSALLAAGVVAVGVIAACSDDPKATAPTTPANDAGSTTGAYPAGPYELKTGGIVPPGMSFDGESGPVRIDALYDPTAAKPKLAVIRTSAAWCGTCLWHASHTKRFFQDGPSADRLLLIDLLVADRDNVAADQAALTLWKANIDAPQTLAIDPKYSFGPALLGRSPLPEYVFIDTRTMKILRTASNPSPSDLESKLAISLAEIDGTEKPPVPQPPLTDGFTEDQMDLIRAMKLDETFAPPPDPSNAVGDKPEAVTFGKALFSDTSLSPTNTVSCATCHDPGLELGDGKPQSKGVDTVDRNSPGVALSSHSRWQFWDGRADSLWGQALGPPEDAKEVGSSRLFIAHRIAEKYASEYKAVFGTDPKEIAALPPSGKPGVPEYDALSDADKEKVTRIYVNFGKAVAAFERAIRVKPNRLDAYAGGDTAALTPSEKSSLRAFFVNGCAQCHWGPRLTNDAFHNIRFPTGRQDKAADNGREVGLTKLAAAEFRRSSKWSDAPTEAVPFAPNPALKGAFRTPTLRGLPNTAPYGHGGTFTTLAEVTAHYSTRGIPEADPRAVGLTEEWVPNFDHMAAEELVPFLELLTATIVLPN